MATVFEGERVADIFQLTDDSQGDVNPVYTYYQVPAGHYAEVTVHQVKAGTGIGHNLSKLLFGVIPFNNDDGGNNSLYDGGGIFPYFNSTGNVKDFGGEPAAMRGDAKFLMSSGQTVVKSTSSGSAGTGIAIWCTVKEFINP